MRGVVIRGPCLLRAQKVMETTVIKLMFAMRIKFFEIEGSTRIESSLCSTMMLRTLFSIHTSQSFSMKYVNTPCHARHML
jgi:hypothetical protein